MKRTGMGMMVLCLLLCFRVAAEAGAFDRVKRMFKSKERVTLTGVLINVDDQGPVFRSEDGDAFRLTGNQAEKLREKKGAELSITGYRHGESFDLRRFKILREPEPEPEPEPLDDDNLSMGEERWSDRHDDEPEPEPEPEAEVYVVQKGDTLGKIARRFYGSAGAWGRIAEANGIKDPRRIKVGMKLNIPAK